MLYPFQTVELTLACQNKFCLCICLLVQLLSYSWEVRDESMLIRGHVQNGSTFPGSPVMPSPLLEQKTCLWLKLKSCTGVAQTCWCNSSSKGCPITITKSRYRADFPISTLQDKFLQSSKCTWHIAAAKWLHVPFIPVALSYKYCLFLGIHVHCHFPVIGAKIQHGKLYSPLKFSFRSFCEDYLLYRKRHVLKDVHTHHYWTCFLCMKFTSQGDAA